jgi:hypothetical protein
MLSEVLDFRLDDLDAFFDNSGGGEGDPDNKSEEVAELDMTVTTRNATLFSPS